jgi:tetratricopeptide (TPR) repeat protein
MSLRLAPAWLLGILLCPGQSFADERVSARSCRVSPQVAATRAALNAAPHSLEARVKLADALIEATCYEEAVHALEDGQALHPRSAELQAKLRNARSLASEQSYFDGKDQAEQAARQSRNLLRCTRLADLAACDEALKVKPNDAQIVIARGDALLKAAQPAQALLSYRRARQLAPEAALATKLAAAESQRQSALAQCQKGSGDEVLQACQSALLAGAADEFNVQSRLGLLYQQRNQSLPALAAYVAAHNLVPGDRAVAQAIVALADASASNPVVRAARDSASSVLQRDKQTLAATPAPAAAPPIVAAVGPPAPRSYSNLAEPSRSH